MKPILTTCLAAAAAAISIFPASAETEIDIASTFPKDMIFLGDGLKEFAKDLEEISGGELRANIHGAGELVPALEVLNSVSSGAIAAGYDWVGYWGGSIPVANLVGALPFGPSPQVLGEWMWEGGGMEIMQSAYDKYNVKFLPCVITPAEPAGWFNKEINSPADLEGLRMRIGGLAGRAISKLGVSTQVIPGGEVFVSLERGRIDAAEFSLPTIDTSLQLQNAAKYYYFPGWHQPSSINSVIFNKAVWDGFDEIQQAQIVAACRSAYLWSQTSATRNQSKALTELEAGGTEIRSLPSTVLDALRGAVAEVIAEESAKDPIFKEAYESLTAHITASAKWQNLQTLE